MWRLTQIWLQVREDNNFLRILSMFWRLAGTFFLSKYGNFSFQSVETLPHFLHHFFPNIYLLCKYGDVFSFIFLQNMVETLPGFFPQKILHRIQAAIFLVMKWQNFTPEKTNTHQFFCVKKIRIKNTLWFLGF